MWNTRTMCVWYAFVCVCVCVCVCACVVMHLCGDSKLPSEDRQGDFSSSKLPGRPQERLGLCLLSLAHSDLRKAFWPEIIMAHFLTKISKTQPPASAESEINLAPRLWLQGMFSQRFHKCRSPVPKGRNAGEKLFPMLNHPPPHIPSSSVYSLSLYKILQKQQEVVLFVMSWEQPVGDGKLPSHCQGWFPESETLEIQGGGLCPGANFVSSQPKFIKGSVELTCGWNPLRSLAARSLAVRSWKRTKKSSLVTPLNSLHTASPGQLISNGSDRAQSQGYCKITKRKCSASGLGAWKQWPFHLVSTLFLTISAVFSYLFSRCDQSLQS